MCAAVKRLDLGLTISARMYVTICENELPLLIKATLIVIMMCIIPNSSSIRPALTTIKVGCSV